MGTSLVDVAKGRERHLPFRRKLCGKRLKRCTEAQPSVLAGLGLREAVVDADGALGTMRLASIH